MLKEYITNSDTAGLMLALLALLTAIALHFMYVLKPKQDEKNRAKQRKKDYAAIDKMFDELECNPKGYNDCKSN